jgi:mannose-6-phosphate isomerase
VAPKLGITRLHNVVKEYDWGSKTALAELFGRAASGKPEAELWLGAHPTSPSRLELPSGGTLPLDEAIRRDPESILGARVRAQFGGELPFLFKIIAADKPLSVQAHPDRAQAEEGFRREEERGIPRTARERSYRDPNHKPELICALSPFVGFQGFRPASEIVNLLGTFVPKTLSPELAALAKPDGVSSLQRFYSALMTLQDPTVVVDEAMESAERLAASDPTARAVLDLGRAFPGDVGALSPCLLHPIDLAPTEAIFLPANELHFYARGLGVELMANSDNVLRGGLTSKHVDVPELLRTLHFEPFRADVLRGTAGDDGALVYGTPAAEFELVRIELDRARPFESRSGRSVEIWMVVEGAADFIDGDSRTHLARGGSVLVPASVERYQIEGKARLYGARVP